MTNPPHLRPAPQEAGFALLGALSLILLVTAFAGSIFYSAINSLIMVHNSEDSDQSLLDAQSGAERVKYELYQAFLTNSASGSSALSWFNTWTSNSVGTAPVYRLTNALTINQSTVSVWLSGVVVRHRRKL